MKTFFKPFALTALFAASAWMYQDLPKVDLHVHIGFDPAGSLDQRYKSAANLAAQKGVTFGIAEEFTYPDRERNDALLLKCISEIKKYHMYLGLQVVRPGWTKLYSKAVIDQLDYVLCDALYFPDKEGKEIMIWSTQQVFSNPQDFMDRYVAYHLKVMSEPITVWVNPTLLPPSLAGRYDELWTEERMKTLINAAVKNNIAIEINSRYKIPNRKFLLLAKAAGAHFTFGSNQHNPALADIKWSVDMAKECGITKNDLFIPKRKIGQ